MSISLSKVTAKEFYYVDSDPVRNFLEYLAETADAWGEGRAYLTYITKSEMIEKINKSGVRGKAKLKAFVNDLPWESSNYPNEEPYLYLNITW